MKYAKKKDYYEQDIKKLISSFKKITKYLKTEKD